MNVFFMVIMVIAHFSLGYSFFFQQVWCMNVPHPIPPCYHACPCPDGLSGPCSCPYDCRFNPVKSDTPPIHDEP